MTDTSRAAIKAMIERMDDYANFGGHIQNVRDATSLLRQLLAEREWMPIAEAPKDGRSILVKGGSVHWTDHGWLSERSQRHLQWEPTVWQPLPSPPELERLGADFEKVWDDNAEELYEK